LPVLDKLEPFGVTVVAETDQDTVKKLVREHHLVVLRGLPVDLDIAAWSARLGEIMVWPFGQVLEIEEDAPLPGDGELPFHWDGMYQPVVPELQILHCARADDTGHGARTLFCHTTRLLDGLEPPVRQRWQQITVAYPIPTDEPGTAVSPLVVPHPLTGAPTVRFHEQADAGRALLDELHTALRDPRYLYAHAWLPGDLLIADNHTLLHGREPFASPQSRHLRRVHILGAPVHHNPAVRQGKASS
jgi:alpha-ketoglutarate-dependent taurine dioxygenase